MRTKNKYSILTLIPIAMTTKDFIARVGDLIGKDDLKTAIDELRSLLQKSKQLDELIVQSARFNELMQQIRMGTISFDDASLTKNKIRYAIMDMLRDIEENLETNPAIETELNKTLQQEASIVTNNTSQIGNNSNNNIVLQGIKTQNGNITIGK